MRYMLKMKIMKKNIEKNYKIQNEKYLQTLISSFLNTYYKLILDSKLIYS